AAARECYAPIFTRTLLFHPSAGSTHTPWMKPAGRCARRRKCSGASANRPPRLISRRAISFVKRLRLADMLQKNVAIVISVIYIFIEARGGERHMYTQALNADP